MNRPVPFACASLGVLLFLVPGRADEAQEKAIKLIEKLGGKITRDVKAAGKPVVAVSLWNTVASDADLKALASLGQLEGLNLRFTKVTDAGLKELVRFKMLRTLRLRFTKITDEGVKDIAALKQLRMLDLAGTRVTDAGLKQLAVMKQLETLYTVRSGVTANGVQGLQKTLPKCKIDP